LSIGKRNQKNNCIFEEYSTPLENQIDKKTKERQIFSLSLMDGWMDNEEGKVVIA
jgi:hypothetical protein